MDRYTMQSEVGYLFSVLWKGKREGGRRGTRKKQRERTREKWGEERRHGSSYLIERETKRKRAQVRGRRKIRLLQWQIGEGVGRTCHLKGQDRP